MLVYHSQHSHFNTPAALTQEAGRRLREAFHNVPLYSNYSDGITEGASLPHCLRKTMELEGITGDSQEIIAICYGWYPLLDLQLSLEALSDHNCYIAHFTYGENIPIGFLPDFASADFIELLPEEIEKDLRTFVVQHIDRYDVEIFYRRPDLRQYRLDLSTNSARSTRLAQDIIELKPQLQYGELEGFLKSHPQLLRPYPSYFEIELTRKSPLQPFYWPANREEKGEGVIDERVREDRVIEDRAREDRIIEGRAIEERVKDERVKEDRVRGAKAREAQLSSHLIQKIISDISTNNMPRDTTIALGGLGEPMEHPLFFETVESLLKLEQTVRIYVETFALRLDHKNLERLAALKEANKLHIIIRLNTLRRERYREMYGSDLLDQVIKSIKAIAEKKLPLHFYAEMLRIKENEDEVEAYMNYFAKLPIEVLLQKYNRYIDLLPERRVADLTPLHRDFCWHLCRDIYLTAEGLVVFCKQDPFARRAPAIDFRSHSIEQIYSQTVQRHIASVRGQHSKLAMPCLQCDEWYTFNG